MKLTTELQKILVNPELQTILHIIFDEIDNLGHNYPLIWEWDSGELICYRGNQPIKVILDLNRLFEYPEYRITLKSHRKILSLA